MTFHNYKCRYLVPNLLRKKRWDSPHASYRNRGEYNRYVCYLNKKQELQIPKNK